MTSLSKELIEQLKKGDIVIGKAYNDNFLGMITDIDKDWCNIKTGYGKGTNFSLWFKDKHIIKKVEDVIKK